jgi:PAS domain S-box-containing protein
VQRSRERQLAGILDSTMDAIIAIDAGMRIQVFNRAAAQMFGHAQADMLGAPLNTLIPQASRLRHTEHVARFSATAQAARGMGAPRALTGLRADGVEFPIEASISSTGEGAERLLIAVVRDATRLHKTEQARSAYAAAESAHRAKMEFVSRMGHELRTPLNAVLGLTQLVKSTAEGRLTAAESEQLGLVLAAGARLRALIDDMLAHGPDSVPSPASELALPAPSAAPSGSVLYIEDDAVNALLVKELLARWPTVKLAIGVDGRHGLALARSLQPDLILLDMHLPDLSGLQVLRQLRDDEATRHLQVAALSAGGTPEEVASTLAAGAVRYWTKPIDFSTFLNGLRELLPVAPQ